MVRRLIVHVRGEVAERVIAMAVSRGVTPSEFLRELIYSRLGLPYRRVSRFLPLKEYKRGKYHQFLVTLSDEAYTRLKGLVGTEGKSIASVITEWVATWQDESAVCPSTS